MFNSSQASRIDMQAPNLARLHLKQDKQAGNGVTFSQESTCGACRDPPCRPERTTKHLGKRWMWVSPVPGWCLGRVAGSQHDASGFKQQIALSKKCSKRKRLQSGSERDAATRLQPWVRAVSSDQPPELLLALKYFGAVPPDPAIVSARSL